MMKHLLLVGATLFASHSVAQTEAQGDSKPSFVVSPDEALVAESANEPLFLALFGDSVSLATMADAKLGSPGPRFYADFIGSIALTRLYGATIGRVKPNPTEVEQHDLLTQLFGNMARLRLSPYLGTQPYALPVLIQEATGFQPKVYNGAQMAGAYHFGEHYLDKFERFFQRNPFHKKPEIIIVNFNGMDFMENRTPEEYGASVRAFYARLTKLAPYAKLVITDLSDPIPLLTYPDRVAVPQSPIGPITCSKLYEIVRFGNKTGVYPGAPEAQIEAARVRLNQLRDVLASEVGLLNDDRSVYPSFKGEAILVPAVEDDGTGAEHIAADCIHPDTVVQEAIGWRMWDVIRPLL